MWLSIWELSKWNPPPSTLTTPVSEFTFSLNPTSWSLPFFISIISNSEILVAGDTNVACIVPTVVPIVVASAKEIVSPPTDHSISVGPVEADDINEFKSDTSPLVDVS